MVQVKRQEVDAWAPSILALATINKVSIFKFRGLSKDLYNSSEIFNYK